MLRLNVQVDGIVISRYVLISKSHCNSATMTLKPSVLGHKMQVPSSCFVNET